MKRRLISCFILFLSFLYATQTQAESFVIDDYKVHAQLYQTREIDISEDITVHFNSSAHGIYRTIPLKGLEISNIKVNHPFRVNSGYREKNIKIGDAQRLISGVQNYIISYRLKIHDNKPQIYLNLIGPEWAVPIKHASFYIALPKEVDADKVGLSIGEYGTKGFDGGASFSVFDDHIEGETSRILNPYEGITLRAVVEPDYFTDLPNNLNQIIYLLFSILTFASVVTWGYIGRDDPIVPVVTFNPPADINSAVADVLYHEKASSSSIVALLIELAAKGYIRIDSSKKNFMLYKLKDYDGQNEQEAALMEAVFHRKAASIIEKLDLSDEEFEKTMSQLNQKMNAQKLGISKNDLAQSSTFYNRIQVLIDDINRLRHLYFTLSSLSWLNKILMFIYMIGTGLLTLLVMFNNEIETVYEIILCCGIISIVIWHAKRSIAMVIYIAFYVLSNFIISQHVFGSAFSLIGDFFGGIHKDNIPLLIFGCICFVTTLTCFIQLPKPNYRSQRILGQLEGLKNFIKVAEKPRLEALVKDHPDYFYKILPYAYVLGVSDVWIKQFEDIMIKPFVAFNKDFNTKRFNDFADSIRSATKPSIANGGIKQTKSSGGGGFSGGGFGGGGGGSW